MEYKVETSTTLLPFLLEQTSKKRSELKIFSNFNVFM